MTSNVPWWKRWTLMPHGDSLCAPDAKKWLFGVACFIAIVATFDGLVWGYSGSSYGTTMVARMLIGVFLGILIALGVAVADSWLMTFDRSYGLFDGQQRTWRDVAKSHATFVLRIAIVMCTVLSVRPFLPRILYKNSVTATINERNEEEIGKARKAIEQRWDDRIKSLQTEDDKLAVADVLEVAGHGNSKRYGTGKVHKLMLQQRQEIQDQIAAASTSKMTELGRFKHLGRADLTRIYGVTFLDNDARTRAEILGELQETNSFQDDSLALFEGLIAFFICVLLIAKVAQPHSVLIYYSAHLQSLHEQYLRGTFNQWIAPEERPVNGESRMGAHRFAEWVVNTYLVFAHEDRIRKRHGVVLSEYQVRLDSLKQLEADALPEFEKAQKDHQKLQKDLDAATDLFKKCEVSRDSMSTHLDELRVKQKSLVTTAGKLSGDAADVALKRIEEITAEIATAEKNLEPVTAQLSTLEMTRDRCETEYQQAVAKLERKIQELADIQEEIAVVRQAAIAQIDAEINGGKKKRPSFMSYVSRSSRSSGTSPLTN